MPKKHLDWHAPKLDEHSKRKHKILREYFSKYLKTRCTHPNQEKFRLAIVDGFAGGGRYDCGASGSPLIFLEELKSTFEEITLHRASQNMRPMEIGCLLILNDKNPTAFEKLKNNTAPLLAEIKETCPHLHVEVRYFNQTFEEAYVEIESILKSERFRNILFNLDQYGYSTVNTNTIRGIMNTWESVEIFLTFNIRTVLTFLSPDKDKNNVLIGEEEIRQEIFEYLSDGGELINKKEWQAVSEKSVFEALKGCARFVSPFSINNPKGWRFWLMHFANRPKARQVYNDILHDNATFQAHFGRPGLNMLSYDPREEGMLYLFDEVSREKALDELHNDIPNIISDFGDVTTVEEFHSSIYNQTAAHSDDILKVLIENPDLEVRTPSQGERRVYNTIRGDDTIRLTKQRTLFPFLKPNN